MLGDVWNAVGLGISVVVAIAAFARASYGMTPAMHRRYACIALALGIGFVVAFAWPPMPTVVLLGAIVLVALFYLTSFLRGAEADD